MAEQDSIIKYDFLNKDISKIIQRPERIISSTGERDVLNLDLDKYSRFFQGERVFVSDRLDDDRANNQSSLEKTGVILKNGLSTFGTSILTTAGGIVSLPYAGLVSMGGENFMDSWLDNSLMKGINNLNDYLIRDVAPLYTTKQQQNPEDIFDYIGSTPFWDDLIQGVGFLASAIIPTAAIASGFGKLTKAAQLSRLSKMGLTLEGISTESKLAEVAAKFGTASNQYKKASMAANWLDKAVNSKEIGVFAGSLVSRVGESQIEAIQTEKEVAESLRQQYPEMSEEEIHAIASKQRNNVFAFNMALSIPDAFQYMTAFGRIGKVFGKGTVQLGEKAAASKLVQLGEKGLYEAKKLSRWKKTGTFLWKTAAVTTIEQEEEGLQHTFQLAAKAMALDDNKSKTADNYFQNILNQYSKSWTTLDGQKARTLGGILGLAGGAGARVGANAQNQKMANAMASNLNATDKYDPTILYNKVVDQETGEETKVLNNAYLRGINNHVLFEELKQQALDNNDVSEYRRLADLQLLSQTIAFSQAGKLDDLLEKYSYYGSATQEEYKNYYGHVAQNNEGQTVTPSDLAKNINDKINNFHKIYSQVTNDPRLKDTSPDTQRFATIGLASFDINKGELSTLNTELERFNLKNVEEVNNDYQLLPPDLAEDANATDKTLDKKDQAIKDLEGLNPIERKKYNKLQAKKRQLDKENQDFVKWYVKLDKDAAKVDAEMNQFQDGKNDENTEDELKGQYSPEIQDFYKQHTIDDEEGKEEADFILEDNTGKKQVYNFNPNDIGELIANDGAGMSTEHLMDIIANDGIAEDEQGNAIKILSIVDPQTKRTNKANVSALRSIQARVQSIEKLFQERKKEYEKRKLAQEQKFEEDLKKSIQEEYDKLFDKIGKIEERQRKGLKQDTKIHQQLVEQVAKIEAKISNLEKQRTEFKVNLPLLEETLGYYQNEMFAARAIEKQLLEQAAQGNRVTYDGKKELEEKIKALEEAHAEVATLKSDSEEVILEKEIEIEALQNVVTVIKNYLEKIVYDFIEKNPDIIESVLSGLDLKIATVGYVKEELVKYFKSTLKSSDENYPKIIDLLNTIFELNMEIAGYEDRLIALNNELLELKKEHESISELKDKKIDLQRIATQLNYYEQALRKLTAETIKSKEPIRESFSTEPETSLDIAPEFHKQVDLAKGGMRQTAGRDGKEDDYSNNDDNSNPNIEERRWYRWLEHVAPTLNKSKYKLRTVTIDDPDYGIGSINSIYKEEKIEGVTHNKEDIRFVVVEADGKTPITYLGGTISGRVRIAKSTWTDGLTRYYSSNKQIPLETQLEEAAKELNDIRKNIKDRKGKNPVFLQVLHVNQGIIIKAETEQKAVGTIFESNKEAATKSTIAISKGRGILPEGSPFPVDYPSGQVAIVKDGTVIPAKTRKLNDSEVETVLALVKTYVKQIKEAKGKNFKEKAQSDSATTLMVANGKASKYKLTTYLENYIYMSTNAKVPFSFLSGDVLIGTDIMSFDDIVSGKADNLIRTVLANKALQVNSKQVNNNKPYNTVVYKNGEFKEESFSTYNEYLLVGKQDKEGNTLISPVLSVYVKPMIEQSNEDILEGKGRRFQNGYIIYQEEGKKGKKVTPTIQEVKDKVGGSGVDAKADIERRRQEELKVLNRLKASLNNQKNANGIGISLSDYNAGQEREIKKSEEKIAEYDRKLAALKDKGTTKKSPVGKTGGQPIFELKYKNGGTAIVDFNANTFDEFFKPTKIPEELKEGAESVYRKWEAATTEKEKNAIIQVVRSISSETDEEIANNEEYTTETWLEELKDKKEEVREDKNPTIVQGEKSIMDFLNESEPEDENNAPFKLHTALQGEIIDIEEAKANLKRILGIETKDEDIFDELIEGIADGRLTKDGRILLSRLGEKGSEYHEAFHRVSMFLMSAEKQAAIYKEYKERTGFTGTNREVEEALAEEFRHFMLSGEMNPKLTVKEKSWLQKVLDFIFGVDTLVHMNGIEKLFNEIREGKFKNAPVLKETMSYDALNSKSKMMATFFHPHFVRQLMANKKLLFSYQSGVLTDAIYNDVINGLLDSLVPAARTALITYFETESNKKRFIDAHKTYLRQLGITKDTETVNSNEEVVEEKTIDEEVGEKENEENTSRPADSQFGKEKLETSSLSEMFKPIRLIISGLVETTLPDGAEIAVDFAKLANTIQNLLAGSDSYEEMIYRLQESRIPQLVELSQIVSNIEEDMSWEDVGIRQSFFEQFSKSKTDLNLAVINRIDNIPVSIGHTSSNTTKLQDQIRQGWATRLQSIDANDFVTMKQGKAMLTDYAIDLQIADSSDMVAFLNGIGINIKGVDGAFLDRSENVDIRATISHFIYNLQTSGNVNELFERQKSDNKGFLKQLLILAGKQEGNSVENQGSTPKGKTIFGMDNNSFFTQIINALNNGRVPAHLAGSKWAKQSLLKQFTEKGYKIVSNAELGATYEGSVGGEDHVALTKRDYIAVEFTKALEGDYSLLPTGDKKLSRGFTILDANNTAVFFIEPNIDHTTASFVEEAVDILMEAYKTEKKLDKTSENNTIIDSEGKKIFSGVVTSGVNNETARAEIKQFVENTIEENMNLLRDEKILTDTSSLINPNILKKLIGANKVTTNTEAKRLATIFTVNNMINSLEQTKVFFGHPIYYNSLVDMFKRYSGTVGTTLALNNSDSIRNWMEKNIPRKDGKIRDGNFNLVVIDDIKSLREELQTIKGYEKIKETDSFSTIMDDFYRDFKFQSNRWSEEQNNSWEKEYEGKEEGDHVFTATKPLMWGTQSDEDFIPIMGKTASMRASNSLFEALKSEDGQYPNLKTLFDMYQKKHVDMVMFKSGVKIGAKVDKGTKKGQQLYNEHGEIAELEDRFIIPVSMEYIGINVENEDKGGVTTSRGSQLEVLKFSNYFTNGVVDEGDITVNGKQVSIKNAVEETLNVQNQLTDTLNNEIIEDLKLEFKKNNWTFSDDKDAFLNRVLREVQTRGLSSNLEYGVIQEMVKSEEDGEKVYLDLLVNHRKIENILASIIQKKLVNQTRFGKSLVQFPDTMMEIGVRKIDPVTQRLMGGTLNFYINKEGKRVAQIYVSSSFKGKLQKRQQISQLSDNRLIEVVGFRIPTEQLNSIEVLEIAGFLPASYGDIVIVPSGITTKVGSDFDFDKLNLYFPNFKETINYKGAIKDFLKSKGLESNYEARNEFKELIELEESGRIYNSQEETDLVNEYYKFKDVNKAVYPITLKYVEYNEENLDKPKFRKKALENRLLELTIGLLSNESKQTEHLSPNSIADIETIVEKIRKAKDKEVPQHNSSDILRFKAMTDIKNIFWYGRGLIGMAANHNKGHILAQMSGLGIKKLDLPMLSKFGIKAIDNIYPLGRKVDTEGKLISSITGQIVTLATDAIKNPDFFPELNLNATTLDTVMLLIRAGVSKEVAFMFVSQPIIIDYVNEININNSMVNGIEKTNRQIMDTLAKIYPREESISTKYTEKTLLTYNRDYQFTILNDFLVLKERGMELSRFQSAMAWDTKGFKNTTEMDLNRVRYEVALESAPFVNKERYTEYAQGFRKNVTKARGYWNTTSFIEQLDPVLKDKLTTFAESFMSDYMASGEKVLSLLDTLYNDFRAYVILTTPKKNKTVSILDNYNSLTTGRNSVARRLYAFKKTNAGRKLKQLSQLFEIVNNGEDGKLDNIRPFNKKMTSYEIDDIANELEDMFKIDPVLGEDLIDFLMIQSGFNQSLFNYLAVIPSYTESIRSKNEKGNRETTNLSFGTYIEKIMANFNPESINFDQFKKLFYLNNTENPILVPYIKWHSSIIDGHFIIKEGNRGYESPYIKVYEGRKKPVIAENIGNGNFRIVEKRGRGKEGKDYRALSAKRMTTKTVKQPLEGATKPTTTPSQTEQVKSGFQGYKGGFENTGKGTQEGDGKDKAMRNISNGFIGEIAGSNVKEMNERSSTYTSLKKTNISHRYILREIDGRMSGIAMDDNSSVVMLARNSELRGMELTGRTKQEITTASNNGAEFVVGDMPNVDSQFIDYLQEIGAKFTIYHTGNESRIKIKTNQSTTTPSQTGQIATSFQTRIMKATIAIKEAITKGKISDKWGSYFLNRVALAKTQEDLTNIAKELQEKCK